MPEPEPQQPYKLDAKVLTEGDALALASHSFFFSSSVHKNDASGVVAVLSKLVEKWLLISSQHFDIDRLEFGYLCMACSLFDYTGLELVAWNPADRADSAGKQNGWP